MSISRPLFFIIIWVLLCTLLMAEVQFTKTSKDGIQVISRSELQLSIEETLDGQLELSWLWIPGNLGYNIYHCDYPADPMSPDWNLLISTNDLTYAFTPTETQRFFLVRYIYNATPAGFIHVNGGTFIPDPGYTVSLSSYYIGIHEVTQTEYLAVMGTNPSQYNSDPTHPVEKVSWFKAIEYCNRRSLEEELQPCYTYSGYGNNPDTWPSGWDSSNANHALISCNWDASGYHLPSEMQWHFAAQGGTSSLGYTYSGSNIINDVAWYYSNSAQGFTSRQSHPVGQKLENELGTFDMSGNVWEWVWDRYGDYPGGSSTNPTGPLSGDNRVARGGSWNVGAGSCANTVRNCTLPPTTAISSLGFRLCRRSNN